MRKLKLTLLAAFLFSLLLSSNSFSQDKTAEYNPLTENKWAVIFELGNIFKSSEDYSLYKSYTLNCKYHFTKKTAVRILLGTDGEMIEGSGTQYFTNIVVKKRRSFGMETSIQGVYYLKADTRIKVFACAGPYFTIFHESTDAESSDKTVYTKNNNNRWGLGVAVSFGVEYFILDNISLVGEYFASGTVGQYNYWQTYHESGEYNYYEDDFTEYKFDMNKMRLGFSVYF